MTDTTQEKLPPLPKNDRSVRGWDWPSSPQEMKAYARKCIATLKAENARAAAESREKVGILRDVLYRNGFVECDIQACNCGSWHARYGLKERFDEICDVLREADVLNNETGNLPIRAIAKLVERASAAQSQAAAMAGLLEEARNHIDGSDFDDITYVCRIDAALYAWKESKHK